MPLLPHQWRRRCQSSDASLFFALGRDSATSLAVAIFDSARALPSLHRSAIRLTPRTPRLVAATSARLSVEDAPLPESDPGATRAPDRGTPRAIAPGSTHGGVAGRRVLRHRSCGCGGAD